MIFQQTKNQLALKQPFIEVLMCFKDHDSN